MAQRNPGPIPNRWLNCPRKAVSFLVDKLLAFKTPLGPEFKDVPEANRFTPAMLFNSMKSYKVRVGLWIDLTNTNRFYDKKQVEEANCHYVKLQCRGHGETPSIEQKDIFVQLVDNFLSQNPLDIVGVHCTHGFNRTGFLMVSYLVDKYDMSVGAAINEFAKVRPPGIYKQDYLEELFNRYDDIRYTPAAPALPDWCTEPEDEHEDDVEDNGHNSSESSKSEGRNRKPEHTPAKTMFMPGVPGVQPFLVHPKLSSLQRRVQSMCGWKKKGFPGSQPVTLIKEKMKLLQEKPYRVSWKADGQRYLLLVLGEDEVYFFDRDNCAFKVTGLRFVHASDLKRHLKDTLLDGEMVMDKVNGREIPRFLVYDIISLEGRDVGKRPFYPDRLRAIEFDVVGARYEAMKRGIINKSKEPFSIRNKQFWDLTMARQLLGEKFAKSLSHEPDGLIFQPSIDPYEPGRCENVLKWKPTYLNSIDFKLKIKQESGMGMLPCKIGQLYVGQETAFGTIKLTKELKRLDDKIIECKFVNNQWVFMRERTDKSFPNSYDTAKAVYDSIRDPLTEHDLLELIDHHRYIDDAEVMPPPTKRVCR